MNELNSCNSIKTFIPESQHVLFNPYRSGPNSHIDLAPPLSRVLLQIEIYIFSGGSCVILEKITFSSYSSQTAP